MFGPEDEGTTKCLALKMRALQNVGKYPPTQYQTAQDLILW